MATDIDSSPVCNRHDNAIHIGSFGKRNRDLGRCGERVTDTTKQNCRVGSQLHGGFHGERHAKTKGFTKGC